MTSPEKISTERARAESAAAAGSPAAADGRRCEMDKRRTDGEDEAFSSLTEDDLKQFLSARTFKEQFETLLAHAEKNHKVVKLRSMDGAQTPYTLSYEEVSEQFERFCRTKGIAAKFRVAFSDMAEGVRRQCAADRESFDKVKRQSAAANPEFDEFLHTKGFKAKVRLVVENIRRGARECSRRTAAAADGISARTRADIERAKAGIYTPRRRADKRDGAEYSAEELTHEFNEFLRVNGLGDRYIAEVTEDDRT